MRTVVDILPSVRRAVLELRLTRERAFGLSELTWRVADGDLRCSSSSAPNRSRYTSGAPKKLRGHVQAALAVLAREGIIFSRTAPEPAVQRYEHGETDKRFLFRLSKEQAAKRLKAFK